MSVEGVAPWLGEILSLNRDLASRLQALAAARGLSGAARAAYNNIRAEHSKCVRRDAQIIDQEKYYGSRVIGIHLSERSVVFRFLWQ